MRLCNKSVAMGAVTLLWVAQRLREKRRRPAHRGGQNPGPRDRARLLKQKVNVNAREGDGATALQGWHAMVRLSASLGAVLGLKLH